MTFKAILWDVDGTLAETERDGHRVAFNLAFEACGLPWRWDAARYGELLRITGGLERLQHDMAGRPDAPRDAVERNLLAREIHSRKNAYYADLVRSGEIRLRAGVLPLMQECLTRGRRMAITTTTSRTNVEALLGAHLGPRWQEWFAAVVCGEDVRAKKPDPEVFTIALDALAIDGPDALAIEDSPSGVAAARAASVRVIVTRSAYFATDRIEGAVAVGPGLDRRREWIPVPGDSSGASEFIGLDDLDAWSAA